ncbi:MAG: hypothetical protein JWP12_1485 [Bacteroidetes bacterium]|nr:hypothetical protein [Bacteroidota bacterium]
MLINKLLLFHPKKYICEGSLLKTATCTNLIKKSVNELKFKITYKHFLTP